jgi:hypothetical protein
MNILIQKFGLVSHNKNPIQKIYPMNQNISIGFPIVNTFKDACFHIGGKGGDKSLELVLPETLFSPTL